MGVFHYADLRPVGLQKLLKKEALVRVVLHDEQPHPGQLRAVPAFLPRYSPDFSPIEGAFSKFKAFLRRRGARTQRTLERSIAAGLATFTARDARGWFRHCGFPAKVQSP